MAVRWQFIEERERAETWWVWRIMLLDGTLETQSQRFKSYGAAVGDAIRNGFRPSRHHWIVVTRHTATHFRPGESHVSVPVVGQEPKGGTPRVTSSSAPPKAPKRPVLQ